MKIERFEVPGLVQYSYVVSNGGGMEAWNQQRLPLSND